MIELKNLDKTFRDIHAIDHISGSIREGMVFGMIGSNGAGKSTLLRMISGIVRPDSGEILADGKAVYENPEVKSQICFLSDTPYYFPNADIRQMRDYYMMIYPNFNQKLFDSLTGKFKLEPKRRISSFSKGMKKQVSILLGLCSGTKYLLCDETFDGLDPVVRQAVKSLFASEIMNRDFTPVISSHNLRELEDICDSIGLLHQGKLLLTQDLDQIKCSICKLQCVVPDPHREQALIRSLRILRMERTGSLLTLTVRGDRSQVLELVQAQEPLFAEVLPLTLEEIFISETEVAGYDIKDFLH
ncbi:ABC transporter ATP-binding protein [Mediterraneibacter glycyrrhizinilyticus]|nr:ABC transporter ATP-binding protein [Mediterraneibacter glycyrrhizinilyticus]MBM6855008.1 ABC transporter ATP-binding protein [Mediterraneibacter glycyrrhizinilyticus]